MRNGPTYQPFLYEDNEPKTVEPMRKTIRMIRITILMIINTILSFTLLSDNQKVSAFIFGGLLVASFYELFWPSKKYHELLKEHNELKNNIKRLSRERESTDL